MRLSGRNPMGPTVNHRTPLSLGGKRYDPSNLEPMHNACNARLGANSIKPVRSRQW